MKPYQCIAKLEKSLSNMVDEVMSCATAYFSEDNCIGSYRVLLDDLTHEHGFDERYAPLLVDMLNERADSMEFEVIDDEIMGYSKQQTQIFPFSPKRMDQLLDKALDWIGENNHRHELYDTLRNILGMTDDEIKNAKFELDEFSEEPTETQGMSMM
jgi:hypothetical protein